jgi:RimJ/RimL family protein N-acetyltransferase
MNTIWTGERVRLRPFRDEDERCSIYEELHVTPNEFWGAWWSARQQVKKDFEDAGMLHADKYSTFAIERLDTNQLVGYEEHGFVSSIAAWVGTFIKPEHWHRGFGIEAKQLCYCYLFESFPFLRVDSGTLEHHVRARNGLMKSGMSYEGRVRRMHCTEGRYYDMVTYYIFREDWEKLPIRQTVRRGAL